MSERQLVDLLGAIYDASISVLSWTELGSQLCSCLAAERVYLGIKQPDGTLPNLLRAPDTFDTAYSEYYHKVDPFRLGAAAAAQETPTAPYAILGEHIAFKSEAPHGEYYTDYAKRRGTRHSLAAQLDTRGEVLIGVFRESNVGRFTGQDLRSMEVLLPHLHRGLQLSKILIGARPQSAAGYAALDALSLCVIVVDASMRVVFANAAAERLTANPGSGLRIIQSGIIPASGKCFLHPSHVRDVNVLRALVAATATNGPGGALRLQASRVSRARAGAPATAVLVSPMPARFAAANSAGTAEGLATGLVMIVARDLTMADVLPARLLSDLFGLSSSEAAVATLVLGGATAENVARARHVSIETVRRQIQFILRKTGAANLRDFERIAASLALIQPQAGSADRS